MQQQNRRNYWTFPSAFLSYLDCRHVMNYSLSSFKDFVCLHKKSKAHTLPQNSCPISLAWSSYDNPTAPMTPCIHRQIVLSADSLTRWVIPAYLRCKSCSSTTNYNGCQGYFWCYQFFIRTIKQPYLIPSSMTEWWLRWWCVEQSDPQHQTQTPSPPRAEGIQAQHFQKAHYLGSEGKHQLQIPDNVLIKHDLYSQQSSKGS